VSRHATDVELLERERELGLLAESMERARRSEGTLMLVEGPAGIGKSALLDRGRELALRIGVRVLSARGGELEREFPYGVVRQLFEPALQAMSVRRRRELFAGAAALALPLAEAAGADVRAAHVRRGDDPFAVLHGLYWLTANMAAREPLAVVVDDAHWSDSPTQRFLLYLARRLEGSAVTMVLAIRAGEPGLTSAALSQLALQPGAIVMRPAALSESGVARLVDRGLRARPDASFVAACHDVTGGTPFLVRELVAALAADHIRPTAESAAQVADLGPATVAHAVLLPLAQLPASAMALVRAVAVLGSDAALDLAARLAGLDESEALDAADALVAMRMLRPGLPLEFVHPIVRTAVYEDLPRAWRSAAHLRAARLLEEEGASVDAVVAHLLCTEPGGRPRVIETLRAGADSATRRGAPEISAVFLRRGLAEGCDRDLRALLLHELVVAEKLMRDPRAIGHFEEAMRLERDPLRRAAIARDLAETLIFSGVWERAPALLEAALADASGHDDALVLRIETMRAGIATFDPRLVADLDKRLPQLRAAAEGAGSEGRELSLLLASLVALRGGPREDVLRLVLRGLDDGRSLADEGADSMVLPQGFCALMLIDEAERAARLADDMVANARKTGSRLGFVSGLAHRALAEVRRGNLVGAEADLRDALDGAIDHDLQIPLPATLWYGADAIIDRPELADLAAMVQAIEVPAGLAPTFTGAVALEVRGRVRLLAGEVADALADLRAWRQTLAALGFNNPNLSVWRSHIALALAGTEPGEARALAAAELRDARRIGVARGTGVALRTAGLLAGGEDGIAMLREAVSMLERASARLEYARALVELGAALRRANQRAAARDPLRTGLEMAHRCGATRRADRATTELAATGARPRRLRVVGRDALTPSERRIARMAAEGLSNREIAQALFVTAKTVENHLGHIYHKFGVGGRGALAEALEREQPAP
jgi:DNA-binding CsgD family transcriptional regulator